MPFITSWSRYLGGPNQKHLCSIIILVILGIALSSAREIFDPRLKNIYKKICYNDEDCLIPRTGLKCTFPKDSSSSHRLCTCADQTFKWREKISRCLPPWEGKNGQDKAAKIITILVPILAAAFIVGCVAFMCCYYVQSTAKTVKKDVVRRDVYDDHEVDFSESEDEDEEMNKDSIKMTDLKKLNDKQEKKEAGKKVPDLKVNGIKETTLSNGNANGHVVKENGKPNSILQPSTPLKDRENGYQASMRQFLLNPQLRSEPTTRPGSAFFISNTRPGTSHSAYLNPRQSRPGTGARPMGFMGPYVTDTGMIRSRPLSAREGKPLPKPMDLSELYDKIAAVSDQEEKKKEEEKAKKQEENEAGAIEEIKLVKAAVKAFKRRRNMKQVKEEQKRKKGKKFETLVDQILKAREEEQRKPRQKYRPKTNKARRDSRSSDGSRSGSRSRPVIGPDGRPESVAQRVLRERQERRITAKVPITPNADVHHSPFSFRNNTRRNSSANAPQKPLHVALRQSASQHSSRAQMKERIKQQVHFNVVRNYHSPSVEVKMSNPGPPVKSILKKNSTGSNKSSGGRVNYAFDKGNDEVNNVHSVQAEVYTIS